nr:hypothetical protein [Tanacetum cinerariifolium]
MSDPSSLTSLGVRKDLGLQNITSTSFFAFKDMPIMKVSQRRPESLVEASFLLGADNHPSMLDKTQYSSWEIRMLLYIKVNENKKLHVDSVLNGLFKYKTVTEPKTATTPATVRDRRYDELTNAERIHEACDIKAINIVLQGLPQDIYNLQLVLPLTSQQLYDIPMFQQQSYQEPVSNHSLVAHYQSYQAPDVHQPPQASFSPMDSGLIVPSFLPSDDPYANLNEAMALINTTFTS